jgi:hypothetical protein
MDMEQQITDAIVGELRRQAENGGLQAGEPSEGVLEVQGRVKLDELAMAVAGAVAGGP